MPANALPSWAGFSVRQLRPRAKGLKPRGDGTGLAYTTPEKFQAIATRLVAGLTYRAIARDVRASQKTITRVARFVNARRGPLCPCGRPRARHGGCCRRVQTRPCRVCGQPFPQRRVEQVYCSRRCAYTPGHRRRRSAP